MVSFEELCREVYEDLNGRIVAVTNEQLYRVVLECDDWESTGKGLQQKLTLDEWKNSRKIRRFELTFDDVKESTATPSSSGNLSTTDDHPLLWNHNEEHLTMYFSSAPEHPVELVGLLYEAHSGLLKGWRKLSDYLHAGLKLMTQGYGVFAEGPRRVIEEYARVVGSRCQYTIVPAYTPKGGYRVVLFDECHVVCRGITVVEQEFWDNSDA